MIGRILTLAGLLTLSLGFAVEAQQSLKHVQPSLVAEKSAITPGGTVSIGLHQIIEKDWHTYWRNPGDAGAATAITWHLPQGWSAGAIQWPYPSRVATGPVMNFAFSDDVMLISDLKAPVDAAPGPVTLSADVTFLVCKDICVPEDAHVELPFMVGEGGIAASTSLFAAAREKFPRPSPWTARFAATDQNFSLLIESADLPKTGLRDAAFFPYTDGIVEGSAPQALGVNAAGLVLTDKASWRLTGADRRAQISAVEGVLVTTSVDGRVDAFEVHAPQGVIGPSSPLAQSATLDIGFGKALLFAFLGGLILNLMPCVLPVLSMKAIALARKSGAATAAHADSLAYGAGVLVCFGGLAAALLALRAGGAAIGWGFQLQEPVVVASFALLMFAVGLNLSGLFEIGGGRFAGMGQKFATKSGWVGSFFTGALAVAVATPCTAPFMGAAMGFALTQNAGLALGVFLALGLGFAAPFVALGYSPMLLRALPRPGAWMVSFRQFLAFPMYGASIWLVWVLAQQAGPDGVLGELAAALALAFALWSYGASQRAYGLGQMFALGAALAAVIFMVFLVPRGGVAPNAEASLTTGKLTYERFSDAKLAELRGQGRPVFVNATAAWCITCLANERVALSSQSLSDDFTSHKIAALKADWTNRDPEITALLSAHGRLGVPLYLYFAPGAAEPVVLPQILTEGLVRSALGISPG